MMSFAKIYEELQMKVTWLAIHVEGSQQDFLTQSLFKNYYCNCNKGKRRWEDNIKTYLQEMGCGE